MVGQMGSERHAERGAQTGLGWWTTTHRSVASQGQGMAKILFACWSRSTVCRALCSCFLPGGNIPSSKHWAVTSAPEPCF